MMKKVIVALTVALAATAHAQASYPTQPIRLISISAAGSGGDILARYLAEQLGQEVGGRVFVDNKPGAGGAIATDLAARAPADGYHLVLGGHSTHILLPITNKAIRYDPINDFVPIGSIGGAAALLVATPDFPANSIADLKQLAKSRSEEIQYASWGQGSTGHFCGAMLNLHLQGGLSHIPYKAVAPIMNDLLGGRIKLAFVDMGSGVNMVNNNQAKAIASCTEKAPALPSVRSYVEEGIQVGGKVAPSTRWTLYAPAATPKPVVDRLGEALSAVMAREEVNTWMLAQGISPKFIAGPEVAEINRRDIAFWSELAKLAKISTE
jgi:tripartite-type tricarboxylate transporter receptor subunit TctC